MCIRDRANEQLEGSDCLQAQEDEPSDYKLTVAILSERQKDPFTKGNSTDNMIFQSPDTPTRWSALVKVRLVTKQ